MLDFSKVIAEIAEELVAFRHDLHTHPETGYEEKRTAARVVTELSRLPSLRITDHIVGTGVLALLNAHQGAPCVLLRAGLDALPLTEKTELPYTSQAPGRMHACGHDGHVACLLGAARVLDRFAEQLPGTVKFLFQPAEESGGGARRMIEAGVLDHPRVDAAFALHGWPDLDLGTVAVVETVPALFQTEGRLETVQQYPAWVNDAACAELVAEAAAEILGPAQVVRSAPPSMAAEDFAFYARAVPSAWYKLGLHPAGTPPTPPLHHPRFDFTDAALPIGVHLHGAIAYRFLTRPPTWKCG